MSSIRSTKSATAPGWEWVRRSSVRAAASSSACRSRYDRARFAVIPDPAGSTIELERASDSDLPALADLMNAAYGGTGEIASWTHVKEFIVGDRTSPAALRAEMA